MHCEPELERRPHYTLLHYK